MQNLAKKANEKNASRADEAASRILGGRSCLGDHAAHVPVTMPQRSATTIRISVCTRLRGRATCVV